MAKLINETIETMFWCPEWCDCCQTWHEYWFGYDVLSTKRDGITPTIIQYVECDRDGNWEHGELTKGEKWCAEIYEEGYVGSIDAQIEYWKYVAETGDDVLEQFINQKMCKKERKVCAEGEYKTLEDARKQ